MTSPQRGLTVARRGHSGRYNAQGRNERALSLGCLRRIGVLADVSSAILNLPDYGRLAGDSCAIARSADFLGINVTRGFEEVYAGNLVFQIAAA
jgi:hypothetical protein